MQFSIIKSFIIGTFILSIGIGGFVMLTKSKPVATIRDLPESVWRVSVIEITLDQVAPVFSGFGIVENPDTQIFKGRFPADVLKIHVREGDQVLRGDLLVELDTIEPNIKLAQVQANLADTESRLSSVNITEQKDLAALVLDNKTLTLLEQSLTRLRDLKKRKLASDQDLDEARRALVAQKLQINRRELGLATADSKRLQLQTSIRRFKAEAQAAQRDLASTTLAAPENGQIVSVHSVVGGRVQANQNLITFAPNSGRELRVQVTSEVGLSLSKLLAIDLSPDAYLDSKIPLELTRVASIVNKKTGSLDAFFSSPDRLPPVGTVVGVSINLTSQSDVAVIPTDALYGGNLIYRLTETNHLQGITVNRLGQRPGNGRTEVLVQSKQLKTGDRVLTSRLPAAVTGLKVEVNE